MWPNDDNYPQTQILVDFYFPREKFDEVYKWESVDLSAAYAEAFLLFYHYNIQQIKPV